MQTESNLGGGGRYRPPALRALASGGSPPNEGPPSATTPGDGSTLPPTNYPAGFRRARAGTLPSNVQLAAQQRFTETTNTLPSAVSHQDLLLDQTQRALAANSTLAPSRPALRHTSSVASTVPSSVVTERASRLRAGSLTLPSAGLTNAFGSSLFSSPWMPSSNNGTSGIPVLEERSVTSVDSDIDSFDVHTLNYLGLDDHRPPAATLSELRNQAQAALAGNLANPNRMRASTVSTYGRRPQVGSLISTPAGVEEEYFIEDYDDHAYGHQHLTPTYETQTHDNGYTSSYLNQGLRATEIAATRPRAISVGTLDDPMRSLPRRATTAADTLPYLSELTHQAANLNLVSNNIGNNIGNPSSILKTDKQLAGSRTSSSPSVHFPNGGDMSGGGRGASAYLLAPNNQPNQNRSVSPKSEGQSSQMQTPTRSLWIGNLDSSVTSEQLIHVFAPYGAIESLRLLPEKVCFEEITVSKI